MLADEGQVRVEDFVAQIDAFFEALRQTDRIVSKKDKPTVLYRIVDLSHRSPSKVTLAAFPIDIAEDYSDETVKRFLAALEDIGKKDEAPADFDYEALEAYKEIAKKIDKGLTQLTVSSNGYRCDITQDYPSRIQLIQGSDEVARGSMSGRIEAISFHTPPYRFTLYPIVGPQRVRCNFPTKKKSDAISAIDKYVIVYGTIKYRHKSIYPYEIDVEHIEIPPPEETLPRLSELKGIAPDLTQGLTPEEYVRRNRDLDG